jgi:predicted RNA-binding Zn-ribbon protein involved in translation (DUF1610 family)
MWFFKTETGMFCIRYLREGYGLFIEEDNLNWFRDAEAAVRSVAEHRTGHRLWDASDASAPEDLNSWQTLAEIKKGEQIPAGYDPYVVTLDCSCGNQLRESIGRIRTICRFRCPQCGSEVRVSADELQEIIEKLRKERPGGLWSGRNKG